MGKSCLHRLEIYNSSGITGDTAGEFIDIPADVDEWYVKLDLTEDSAGSITPILKANESKSTSDTYDVEAFGALSATGITRQQHDAADEDLLGPYLYLDLTSVSGEWTVICELWYSKQGT